MVGKALSYFKNASKVSNLLVFIFSLLLIIGCTSDSSKIYFLPKDWEYSLAESDETYLDSKNKIFSKLDEEKRGILHTLIPKEKGYLWIKNEFIISEEELSQWNTNLAISPGRIAWADETYLNGVMIGKSGKFPPHAWSAWNNIREYNFSQNLLKKGKNELMMKLYAEGEGFLYEEPILGTASDVESYLFFRKLINTQINALVAFLFLIVSFYHFLIYWKRKKDKENYYYGVFALLYAIYCTNFFSDIVPYFITIPYIIHQKFIIFIQAAMVYFVARFFIIFFKIHMPNWVKYLYLGALGLSVVFAFVLFEYKDLHKYRGLITLLQFLPALFFMGYSIYRGFKDKNPNARAIMYGIIPLLFVVVHDVSLVIFGLQGAVFLAGLGLPLFLGSIMFVLASKFVAVQNQTDELNATLEAKVIERTKEVTQKMEEIQELKIQQDGDYFLTSLIARPLNTNYNKSKLVSTQTFLKQKKRFVFRNRDSELGGDLCITGNLRFGDGKDRWIVAFNADAMGKSMQGAGGAIVAGTAMNNIIGRSARNNAVLKISPEEWVEDTYRELDSIFKTFNGSMLISCVLALINERTGEMYYFNAEHPWTAVYRDGKASFIEHELTLRKLGSDSEFPFRVMRHKLLTGDVLFMGSDGRDDINIGEKGERILNEDETLFLRLIEEANGDLKNLADLIEFRGELTDDLSLIRIGFQEEFNPLVMEEEISAFTIEEAQKELKQGNRLKAKYILDRIWEEDKSQTNVLKLLIKILFEDKKYGDCIDRINEFHKINPTSDMFWFEKAVCYKQLHNYEAAKAAGEVCRKFQPKRIANLINLADSYRMLGDYEHARAILKEVLQYEPNNETAQKLANKLASSI